MNMNRLQDKVARLDINLKGVLPPPFDEKAMRRPSSNGTTLNTSVAVIPSPGGRSV
jgi:hypothetical protein